MTPDAPARTRSGSAVLNQGNRASSLDLECPAPAIGAPSTILHRLVALLAIVALSAAAGCARELNIAPPKLVVERVSLEPLIEGSNNLCRIVVEVRNPATDSRFDATQVVMTIELRAISPTGNDQTISAEKETVPAGQTVPFKPDNNVNGFEAFSYTVFITRAGEQELRMPKAGEPEAFVAPCSK